MISHTTQSLDSGLPVLTSASDGTASVTAMVFAGAGSRYEKESERGISHFLEHMFFKGGDRYKTTKEVSVAIDAVGGEFNAFTGKEYAGYYVKVAAEHVDPAVLRGRPRHESSRWVLPGQDTRDRHPLRENSHLRRFRERDPERVWRTGCTRN